MMKGDLYFNLMQNVIKVNLQRKTKVFFPPYKLTIVSTYKCNSKCKTCDIWNIYRKNPQKYKEELTDAEIFKAATSLKENLLWLNFTGGEPTLRKNLGKLICDIYDQSPKLRLINIPTNGIIPKKTKELFEQISKHCKKADVYVTISLDGLHEVHDEVRGIKNNFKLAMESFNLLKRLKQKYPNFFVSFQMTISPLNVDKAIETYNFIKEKGDEVIITFAHEARLFHNKGFNWDVRNNPEKIIPVINEIEKDYKLNSIKSWLPKRYLQLSKKFVKNKKSPIQCSAGYATLTLDAYGDILPCLYLDEIIGNVKNDGYDLKKILQKKGARAREKTKQCTKCWQNCEAYPSLINNPFKLLM